MPTTIIHDFRSTIPLVRPPMPTKDDQIRAERQMLRARMLNHSFDEDAAEFFEEAYGEENAQTMGIPDTTLAPLPAQTSQLTTPGLYQTPPTVRYRTSRHPAGVKLMLDPQTGTLARCGYWSRMRDVMFRTVGIGNWAMHVGTGRDEEGEVVPVLTPARPFDLYVECPEANPTRPHLVAWLRIRTRTSEGGTVKKTGHYWDVYDLRDIANPTFQVLNAEDSNDTTDYSPLFFAEVDGYPWLTPEGQPFLPFVFYCATDTGEFWNEYRPALRQGTLRAVANWTMTGQAALWSQGNHNLIGGVDPSAVPGETRRGDEDHYQDAAPLVSMRNTPGKVTFLPVEDDKQLQHLTMTTGVDLSKMVDFANTYGMNLAITDGISPSDATRRSANPTSGAALTISQADKRAFAAQVTPAFNRADLQAVRVIAWTMSAETGIVHEAEGYSITYAPIPLTPTEQKDQREHLQWEETQGVRSKVDVYTALNPGATREQALDAIVEAAVDEALIEARIAERLEEEGLTPAPVPPIVGEDADEDSIVEDSDEVPDDDSTELPDTTPEE